ncbi:MAG TPA: serine protease [Pirellulales bacterium]|jgi:hypothetical protein
MSRTQAIAICVLLCAAQPLRAAVLTNDEAPPIRLASLWSDFFGKSTAEQTPDNTAQQPGSQPTASQQTPLPAVVRVIATDRNSMSLGSGTLVDANDDYGLVVTNWHVVRDAVGPIEVVFPDGFHSMARVVRTDKEWDLAALLIWKPPVQPIPVSTTPPRPGEMLSIAGYGHGDYKFQSGVCTQYLSPVPGGPQEIVEVAAAARHGDSGGPILNSRGEIAGVLFGEGGGRTDGSYGGRVNRFLQLAATDLRGLPASGNATHDSSTANLAQAPGGAGNAARFAGGIDSATPVYSAGSSPSGGENPFPHIADRSGNGAPAGDRAGRALALAGEPGGGVGAMAGGFFNSGSFVWANELKSFLAAFGVAALVLNMLRWLLAR